MEDHHVLDAHPSLSGEVDAGLDGDHRAGWQDLLAPPSKEWILVDLQTDTVPQRMRERVAVAGVLDDGPNGTVEGTGRHPGAGGVDARLLRPPDQLVDLTEPWRRLAEGHGPGHVRVIALHHATEVHLHQITPAQRAVRGAMV